MNPARLLRAILVFSILVVSSHSMAAMTYQEWHRSMIEKASKKRDLGAMMLAKDLTMSDYFAGYVNRLPNRKVAIKEISRKLSAKEIESLMGAFSESQQDQRPDTSSRPSAFENHDPIR